MNFSPKDLTPVPGIAESWDVSDDKKTVTFHLDPDAKWSDGKPITSADVKYSLEVLGGNGALFTSYTENVTKIETPDAHTVVVKTSRPDARIVGGLFIYILPKHVWGKVPVSDLTGSYDPKLPLVGSGPFIVTDFQPNRITTMEKNPYFRGPEPKFDEIQFIRYGNQDAAERALQVGEVDMVPEVSRRRLRANRRAAQHRHAQGVITGVHADGVQQLPGEDLPGRRRSIPRSRTRPSARPRPTRSTASASTRSPPGTPRSRATESCRRSTSRSTSSRRRTTRSTRTRRSRSSTTQAGQDNGDGPRTKGGEELSFNLYVRSESPYDIQAAKLVAEEAKAVGHRVRRSGGQHRQAVRPHIRKVNGKPAPDLRHVHLGLGRRSLRPELPAQHPHDRRDRRQLRLVLLEPRPTTGSIKQQAGEFDIAERKEIIQRMVAITQRDLPYLVLTYDPNLQAYRTDRVANVEPVCPRTRPATRSATRPPTSRC